MSEVLILSIAALAFACIANRAEQRLCVWCAGLLHPAPARNQACSHVEADHAMQKRWCSSDDASHDKRIHRRTTLDLGVCFLALN
jgi:hypothetical protein